MRSLPVLLLAVLALALAACGGGGDDTPGDRAGDTGGPLRLQLTADAEEAQVWERLADAYAEAEPDAPAVRVDAVPKKDDHLQRLATAFAAKRPPDVMLVNHRDLGPFLRPGALTTPGVTADGLAEAPAAAFTVDGELRCAPLNTSSLVVYLNLQRLKTAGVTPPAGGRWSFEEFLTAARALKAKAGEDEHAVGIEPSLIRAAPFVWSAGGELVRDGTFALDEPAARRGLQAMIGLREDGLSPGRTAVEALSLEDRFAQGKLGMIFTSRREVPAFRRLARFDWDVAGFPSLGQPVSVLHTDGLCVPEAGRSAAAQAFVRFAAGPEGQRVLSRAGRIVPTRQEIAESEDFLVPGEKPAGSQVFIDAIPTLRALPTVRNFGPAEDEADLAIEEAFFGQAPLGDALERLQDVPVT